MPKGGWHSHESKSCGVGGGRRVAAVPGLGELERARVLEVHREPLVLGRRRVRGPLAAADRIGPFRRARGRHREPSRRHGHAHPRLVRLDHVRVDARVVVVGRVVAENEPPVGRRERRLLRAIGVARVLLQELMRHPADVRSSKWSPPCARRASGCTARRTWGSSSIRLPAAQGAWQRREGSHNVGSRPSAPRRPARPRGISLSRSGTFGDVEPEHVALDRELDRRRRTSASGERAED